MGVEVINPEGMPSNPRVRPGHRVVRPTVLDAAGATAADALVEIEALAFI
ncbi:MAG TPA: hypothetical protein VH373_03685 [Jatrophihabitantaceae bacterium]|jgi:hypothetical protein